MDQANSRGAGATPTATNTAGAVPEGDLKDLARQFERAASRDVPLTISPESCDLLFRAMTTPPAAAPSAPVGTVPSVDTPEFQSLIRELLDLSNRNAHGTLSKIIAHIDQHVASQVRAARDAAVPAGWKLVPLQMTDAMRDAGNEIILDRCKLVRAYKAMLAAAPAISYSGEGAAPVDRNAVLEEAAKCVEALAKSISEEWIIGPVRHEVATNVITNSAKAIRALQSRGVVGDGGGA